MTKNKIKINLWSIENVLYTEHRHNSEDFFTAAEVHRHDEHLGRLRLQREFSHLQ